MQDTGFESLGSFPLLQLAAAIAVLIGLAFAIYRGSKDRRPVDDQFQRWFFDGPLVRALELLRDLVEESRKQTSQLDEIKDIIHDFRNDKFRRR